MQRLLMATLAGDAADAAFAFFGSTPDPGAVDRFCIAVSDNRLSLPIVYFCEWVDRWLMGDQVPGPNAIHGGDFQASCMTPAAAVAWAERCGDQFQEQLSFAARLREAALGWGTVSDRYAIVVIREVLHVSTGDDEVEVSLRGIPNWWPASTIAS
jgi:hypothetical protein